MNWKWLESLPKWKGALGKYQGVLLVIAAGVLLLLLPTGGGTSSKAEQPEAVSESSFDLEAFEQRLEGTLSRIQGAGGADAGQFRPSGAGPGCGAGS